MCWRFDWWTVHRSITWCADHGCHVHGEIIMSERHHRGYTRRRRDRYETPAWATMVLIPHLHRRPSRIWEPACASGKMVRALKSCGYNVTGSDIADGKDFLHGRTRYADAIITNPPFKLADDFIIRALELTKPVRGLVAMLLRTDFDHAATRRWMFDEHPAFARKVMLLKRIRWIERSIGAPSFNHAWFVWSWTHHGPSEIVYQRRDTA